ncbi:MAG: hypothetical protein LBB75_00005 [Oscillospiraceae bacterium]|nr:hypothetical protein [Oscillospiraceae bacterium]
MKTGFNRFRLFQALEVHVRRPCAERLDRFVADQGVDVVFDERRVVAVGGQRPLAFAVERHEILQELTDGLPAGRDEGAVVQIVLDLGLAGPGLFAGGEALPDLLPFSLHNCVVNNRETPVPLDD